MSGASALLPVSTNPAIAPGVGSGPPDAVPVVPDRIGSCTDGALAGESPDQGAVVVEAGRDLAVVAEAGQADQCNRANLRTPVLGQATQRFDSTGPDGLPAGRLCSVGPKVHVGISGDGGDEVSSAAGLGPDGCRRRTDGFEDLGRPRGGPESGRRP